MRQGIDQGGFHQPGFIHRPPRVIIWSGSPFNHPLENLELAEFAQPGGQAVAAQIIDKRFLGWPSPNCQERPEFMVEKIPFQLETA